MNANKLADKLQDCYEKDVVIDYAATMLRTIPALQAEIETLKSEIVSIEKNTDYWADKSNWIPIQKSEAWEGGEEWEQLAWELCSDEHGEESCTDLIWDMGVIPEPWGDRWQKYEDEAKRMIYMVRKFTHPVKEQSNLVNVVKDHIEDLWRCIKTFRSYEMDNTADEMEVAIKELEDAIESHPVKEEHFEDEPQAEELHEILQSHNKPLNYEVTHPRWSKEKGMFGSWQYPQKTYEDGIEECAKRAEAYAYLSPNFTALAEELRAILRKA